MVVAVVAASWSGPGGSGGAGTYMLGLGVVMAILGSVGTSRGLRSASWPTVDGVVRDARIERDDGEQVEVEVVYVVGGREYRRRETVVGSTSFRSTRDAIVRRLPPGTPIVVHHHPQRPSVSRLRTGLRWEDLLVLVLGLVIGAVGIGVLAGQFG